LLYDNGAPDQSKLARGAFQRGCDLGEWRGCSTIGWLLLRGVYGPAAPEDAFRQFDVACAHEDPSGCFGLGLQQHIKASSQSEDASAILRIEWACDHGLGAACSYRAKMLIAEDGKIPERAHRLFERGCTLGEQASCEFAKMNELP
jgi:TPR repeat protein